MSRIAASITLAIVLMVGCKSSRPATPPPISTSAPASNIVQVRAESRAGERDDSANEGVKDSAMEWSKAPSIPWPPDRPPEVVKNVFEDETYQARVRAQVLYEQGYGYNNPNVDRIRQGKEPVGIPFNARFPQAPLELSFPSR